MNRRAIVTMLRKELHESFRDRRTLLLMVLLPVVLYPAILIVFTQVAGMQHAKLEAESSQVALVGDATEGVARSVERAELLSLVEAPEGDPTAAVLDGAVHAVARFEEGFTERLGSGVSAAVTILFDASSERSVQARDRLRELLSDYAEAQRAERLVALDIDRAFIDPVLTESENVAPPARMGGHVIGLILPLLLVLTVMIGAFHPAVDLTAGEKERGTLQTLLTAPVTPLEIVTAKYLAVCAIAFVAGLVNVGSFALLFGHASSLAGGVGLELELDLGAVDIVMLLVATVTLGMLFSAVTMTVAVLARSFKEAQSYLSPIYIVAIMPAMLAQLPGMELNHATSLVPALNVALLLRGILGKGVDPQWVFVVIAASLIYTSAALALAARLFQRESVLLGDAAPLRGLLSAIRPDGTVRSGPTVGEAFVLYGLLFVLLFYVGATLQAWNVLAGLAITLWGLLALGAVAFARLRHMPLRDTFALHVPAEGGIVAGILCGLGAWAVVMAAVAPLHADVMPIPEELAERMTELLTAPDDLWGTIALYAVVAVSPAICEELVFRGFLLGAFRRAMPAWAAVALSALLFAVFHLSVYRLIGTFALGLVAGALALRFRSLIPSILFHALNNGVLLALVGFSDAGVLDVDSGAPVWWAVLGGAVVLAAGVALMIRRGDAEPSEEPDDSVHPFWRGETR